SSTRNTHIERLWLKVSTQFARAWCTFFSRLEELHGLDQTNPHHMWLLHFLFLDLINYDCKEFQKYWNAHPISHENRSPQDIFFLGQLEHGIYEDCKGVHPNLEELDEEYEPWHGIGGIALEADNEEWHGIAGDGEEVHQPDQLEAGPDEDFPDYAALVNSIGKEDNREFNQELIKVPKHADPFEDEALCDIFQRSLACLQATGDIPLGYGAHPTEWDDDTGYPSFGIIQTGLSGRKELRIALPDSIWRPRSIQWVQALYLMDQLIDRQIN
ncbi:hypothetical protein BT96DRAFT_838006, partial [Gymnopus androsaceus JB14]